MLLTPYTRRSQLDSISATQVQFAATGLTHRPIKLASASGRIASLTALPSALTISGGAGTKYVYALLAPPSGAPYSTASGGLLHRILNLLPWNRADWATALQCLLTGDGALALAAQNSTVTLVMTTSATPPDTHHVPLGEVAWDGAAITQVTSYEDEVAVAIGLLSTYPLPPEAFRGTTGTGSGNTPAAPREDESATAQTTNTPKCLALVWLFDPATDEHIRTRFMMPPNYVASGFIRVRFKVRADTATSGNMIWKAALAPTVDGSTDDKDRVYNAVALSSAVAAPGTLDQTVEVLIDLTVTNVLAGRTVELFIGRDADNASDTMNASDAIYVDGVLEFATV